MSARSQHHWLAWLLPLIVLRAFVPAGFMLSFDGGRPELMVCSGTGTMPKAAIAAPAAQHEHHDHHAHHAHHDGGAMDAPAPESQSHHEHDSSSASHQNSICPFALVYSTNVTLAGTSHWSALNGTIVSFPSASQPRSTAVLIDRIRGPPLA